MEPEVLPINSPSSVGIGIKHTLIHEGKSMSPRKRDFNVVYRIDKKQGFVSLYFTRTDMHDRTRCKTIPLTLGCELLVDPVTDKFRILDIPNTTMGCELWDSSMRTDEKSLRLQYDHEEATDCFIITLCALGASDRVRAISDYKDSIIFDTQNDKIVRIEIVGATEFLDL